MLKCDLLRDMHTFRAGDGRLFVFDPESMVFFQSSDELFAWIRARKRGQDVPTLTDETSRNWHAMEQKIAQERERVRMRFEKASQGTHILNRLTILTTTACNLQCTYCYASGGSYGGPIANLRRQTAITAIQNILDYYKGVASVQFFGGEPFLNVNLIESICQFFTNMAEKGQIAQRPRFGATTNGTVWNARVADVVKRYAIFLNVSIDGPPEIHDRTRVDKRGKGSFEHVSKTLQCLQEEGIPFSVEVTYSPDSMRQGYRVWDIIEFLAENGIYHSHIVPASYSAQDPQRWQRDERKRLVEEYKTATARALQSLVDGEPRLFSFVTGLLRTLLLKIPQPLVCAAGVHDLAIDIAGNLYPCFMFVEKRSFIQQSALHSLDNEEYRQRGHAFYEQNAKHCRNICQKCWARHVCTSCLGAHYIENGHLDGRTINCWIIQAVLETMMAELARIRQTPHDWQRFVTHYRQLRLESESILGGC